MIHGAHLALAALDRTVQARPDLSFQSLSCRFLSPAEPGENLNLVSHDKGCELNGSGGGLLRMTWLEGTEKEASCDHVESYGKDPVELTFDQVSEVSGEEPLGFASDLARELFPNLMKKNVGVIAIALASSRIVGMKCPGLNSIFSSWSWQKTDFAHLRTLYYRVVQTDSRYSKIDIELSGNGIQGKLETFYRPVKTSQVSFRQLKGQISPNEFGHVRALVIGASRGIGEFCLKAILAGGGQAQATFYKGKKEADSLNRELKETAIRLVEFDVRKSVPPRHWGNFTHFFYFATPPIVRCRTPLQREEATRLYRQYYLESFFRILHELQNSHPEIKVFWPSTSMLDGVFEDFADYTQTKLEGEQSCREFEEKNPRVSIITPRLPPLTTDQNLSILKRSIHPVDKEVLPLIRNFLAPK